MAAIGEECLPIFLCERLGGLSGGVGLHASLDIPGLFAGRFGQFLQHSRLHPHPEQMAARSSEVSISCRIARSCYLGRSFDDSDLSDPTCRGEQSRDYPYSP